MSSISLRNKLNREAYEEDLRANKAVLEREIRQVDLMGEPMRPVTSDEAVLSGNIEKFVNAMLNNLEQKEIVIDTLDTEQGIIGKPALRKDLTLAPLIVDWNSIVSYYINPANTQKQRDSNIMTIMRLEQPIQSLLNVIDGTIGFFIVNIPDESFYIQTLVLLIKLHSFTSLVKLQLKSGILKKISASDIEREYLNFIKNPPLYREELSELFNNRQYQIQFYAGKPVNELPRLERRLLEEELADGDEEDAEELGLRAIMTADEMSALAYSPPTSTRSSVRSVSPPPASAGPSTAPKQSKGGMSDLVIDGLNVKANKNGVIFYQKKAGGFIRLGTFDLIDEQWIEVDDDALEMATQLQLQGKGLGRSRRIKFIPSPLDYRYERDDPYGDYRLE
jgi:hypothetical protein